ncbi:hypothetical protein IT568_04585 [bacterium]|nr:hypothetical protein [bacterium]
MKNVRNALLFVLGAALPAYPQTIEIKTLSSSEVKQLRLENEAKVFSIHEKASQKISELAVKIRNTKDFTEKSALQKKVSEVKKQEEFDYAKARLELAKLTSDSKTISELENSIQKQTQLKVESEKSSQND